MATKKESKPKEKEMQNTTEQTNTNERESELQYYDMHKPGVEGLLYFYNKKRLLKSYPFKIAFLISFVSSAVIFFTNKPLFYISIQTITSLDISVFPSLLGFTIGAYAVIVGFVGVSDMKKFTNKAPGEKGSFYQLLVSIFSIGIFAQFVTILCSYAVSFCVSTKLQSEIFGKNYYGIFDAANALVFFSLLVLSLWSFFSLPYMVINLFNFAQATHSIATIDRIKEEAEGESEEEAKVRLLEEILDELRN